uniref:(northern house mosquito) hypothetical protein n=1 Tax=Culex pipiens TaxID=7175 RepID=A0A8D8MHW5_CULPI
MLSLLASQLLKPNGVSTRLTLPIDELKFWTRNTTPSLFCVQQTVTILETTKSLPRTRLVVTRSKFRWSLLTNPLHRKDRCWCRTSPKKLANSSGSAHVTMVAVTLNITRLNVTTMRLRHGFHMLAA